MPDCRIPKNNEADTLQSTETQNGNFHFKGSINNVGEIVFIKVDTSILKFPTKRTTWISLILEPKEITITSKLEIWPETMITGSPETIAYRDLVSKIKSIANKTQDSISHALTSGDSTAVKRVENNYLQEVTATLLQHKHNYASPSIAYNSKLLTKERLEEIFEAYPSDIKASYYGKLLADKIKNINSAVNIAKSKILPLNISLNTILNDKIDLSKFVQGSELTLIDFWASWCKPCRAEIPMLKEAYEVYNNRGFNILSISSDEKIVDWKKAITEEKMPWTQGIEGEIRVTKDIFGIRSIPAYCLTDKSGNIIAFNCAFGEIKSFGPIIRGSALLRTIDSLLSKK